MSPLAVKTCILSPTCLATRGPTERLGGSTSWLCAFWCPLCSLGATGLCSTTFAAFVYLVLEASYHHLHQPPSRPFMVVQLGSADPALSLGKAQPYTLRKNNSAYPPVSNSARAAHGRRHSSPSKHTHHRTSSSSSDHQSSTPQWHPSPLIFPVN